MADTKLRSPDGREGWFNEKEVAHLTTKEPGERWMVVATSEEAPRDPHDPIEDEGAEAPAEVSKPAPAKSEPAKKVPIILYEGFHQFGVHAASSAHRSSPLYGG
jgi:hypothetical protein